MIKAVDFESIRQMVTNLKTTYVNKLVLSMEKTLNSWSELLVKTLDGTYRDLTIHKGPNVLCKIQQTTGLIKNLVLWLI